jgi:hypothetical protein
VVENEALSSNARPQKKRKNDKKKERNIISLASPQTYKIRNSGNKAQKSVLTSSPCDDGGFSM